MSSYAYIRYTWAVWWHSEVFWPGAGAINWFHGAKTLRELSAQNHTINGAGARPNQSRRVTIPLLYEGSGCMQRLMTQNGANTLFAYWLWMHLFNFVFRVKYVPLSFLTIGNGQTVKKWKNISAVACSNDSKRSGTISGVLQTTYPRRFC